MRSLARPRKITIQGSNGQIYMFLGKPKDDLRKDARLMDFNAIINKLLKSNSESRKRQLRKFGSTCHGSVLILRRYTDVRNRYLERGMWVHTMGPKHYSCSPCASQGLRRARDQKLGKLARSLAALCCYFMQCTTV